MKKVFGILFVLTGIFAIAGGLYTWGDGSILTKTELLTVLIPWADILLTGPVSLITGWAMINNKSWAVILGSFTAGIYVFGSVLVFITVVWNQNYSPFLLIPSISGLLIGLAFVSLALSKKIPINNSEKSIPN